MEPLTDTENSDTGTIEGALEPFRIVLQRFAPLRERDYTPTLRL